MEKHVGFKASLFVIVLLVFIVGGYILMQKSVVLKDKKPNNKTQESETVKDIRLDSTKEYIYYSEVEHITHELDIEYKNITLNFKDSNGIAKKLNDETKTLKESLQYDKENENAVYDNLVSAKYKLYNTYYFDKYISLIVDYYNYDCENLISYLSTETYVFDKATGNLISDEEILNSFELTNEDVIKKVKSHLEDEDVAKTEEDLDIDATIDGLKDLDLFVDKIGRLSLSILVKSDQKDYNEIILLN
ncbi:MAG: hypothetical protein IJO63_04090 [Bacilli bacterium]|nr:hypothetical protein [Bacilli bacterium]